MLDLDSTDPFIAKPSRSRRTILIHPRHNKISEIYGYSQHERGDGACANILLVLGPQRPYIPLILKPDVHILFNITGFFGPLWAI